jgi:hypothetical protein
MMERVNSSMICLIHCKNICKYYNVPHLVQKEKRKKIQLINGQVNEIVLRSAYGQ